MDCIYQACSCVMMDVPREIGFIFCLDLLQTRSTFKPRVKQTIKHYTLHITLHSLQDSTTAWCYPRVILVVISYHVITALRLTPPSPLSLSLSPPIMTPGDGLLGDKMSGG